MSDVFEVEKPKRAIEFNEDKALEPIKAARPKLAKGVKGVDRALAVIESMPLATTAAEFEQLGEYFKEANDREAYIEALKQEACGPIYRTWQHALAEFKPILGKYARLKKLINTSMNHYKALLYEESRRKEAELREEQRREDERRKAEAAEQAAAARAAGDIALAQEITALAEIASAPPMVLQPRTVPKIEGLVERSTWIAEVVDLALVPDQFITRVPKQSLLNAMARENAGTNPPPGVKFVKQTSRTAR